MSVKEGIKQFKVGFGQQSGNSKKEDHLVDEEQERLARHGRENQQLVIYIFVAFVIAAAWILGFWEFSFFWVFGLISITFLIWWGKVLSLTEQCIKQREVLIHRKRALRQSETSEWLNFVINRWWVFSSNSISDLIKRSLDPLLMEVKPAFLESIELESFSVGDDTPFIKYIQVYESASGSGGGGGRQQMSWSSITSPPPGLKAVQQYQIVLEADIGLTCDDFKMIFRTRFGGKWMGMNMDVALEKLNITGKMQLLVHLDMDMPFPHVQSVTVCFLEKPEVWFAVRMLKAVQMMEIPVLKSWLHTLVMDGLTQALVDPGKIDIKVEATGPTHQPAKARAKSRAQGVLIVTISGEQTKGSALPTDGQAVDPLVFVDDVRYCSLRVGDEQKRHTQNTQGSCSWQDSCSFLVTDLKTDKLQIKSKSKILLSTYTLATFDLALTDFPFEHKPCIETTIEEKVAKRQGGGSVKYDLQLEYAALPSIEEEPRETVPQSVAGVMYVCVHSASQLLGLDRNGLSDPYCIIYSNGKKVKTTHYVARNKNPSWEVSTEFIVGDFSRTMLSFTVYDWDGRSVSEDDFLGSAHLLLARDEPSVHQRSLTLGYNVLNVGQVDNNKLGSINVTVIFRPVPSVAKSELNSITTGNMVSDQTLSVKRSIINTGSDEVVVEEQVVTQPKAASVKEEGTAEEEKEEKQKLGSGKRGSVVVGDLLSMGQGLLELNIIQAKDLVSMDSNGFSDPYCDVRINNERKFTTSIKKKTLNPVWDEWVTTQLPKPNEVLEVVVWDRDPFFRKDFLGSVTFTLDDLKHFSRDIKNEGWFQLQRIRSGHIQLRINVISNDMNEHREDEGAIKESREAMLMTSSASMGHDAGTPIDSGISRSPMLHPDTSSLNSSLVNGHHGEHDNDDHHYDNGGSGGVGDQQYSMNTPGERGFATASMEVTKSYLRHLCTMCSSAKSLPSPPPPHTCCKSTGGSMPVQRRRHSNQGAGAGAAGIDSSPDGSVHGATAATSTSQRSTTRRSQRSLISRLKRSHSDVNVQNASSGSVGGGGGGGGRKSREKYATLERSSGLAGSLRAFSAEPMSQATSVASLAAEEKYFNVQGRLGAVRGIEIAAGHVYCKVRLDNRTLERRTHKFSHGKVIAKTASHDAGPNTNFDLCYDIDYGRGVAREALIIFDLKTSHREHLATKGFSLVQILGEENEVHQWLELEKGIVLEVNVSQNNSSPLTPSKKRSSRLFSFSRSKQKLH